MAAPTVALNTPNDVATGVSTTPDLLFTGTDIDSDKLQYRVQVDTANTYKHISVDIIILDTNNATSGVVQGSSSVTGA